MSEQAQAATPEQVAAIQAFNESVSNAVLRVFALNTEMMNGGISPTATALSNALSAADLTAAMVVENGQSIEAVDHLLKNLADDMQKRAYAAFEYYMQQKAGDAGALPAHPANACANDSAPVAQLGVGA